jgi:hypothetical protein
MLAIQQIAAFGYALLSTELILGDWQLRPSASWGLASGVWFKPSVYLSALLNELQRLRLPLPTDAGKCCGAAGHEDGRAAVRERALTSAAKQQDGS